ncbi:MAG: LysE family translocator [Acidobacteriota bacterium]
MLESSTLSLFIIACLVLLLTPGPAVLYIVARSIDQGRMAGFVSVLGLAIGTLFHITAAALGVSALLLSSALAFSAIKYLGAAYLIYLGIKKFLVKEELNKKEVTTGQSLGRIFYQAIVVNILNPKTALFFFAFLPQFVNTSKGSVTIQILLLGLIFVFMGVISDGLYAVLSGTIGNWLRGNLRFLRAQRYFAGSVYIGLGITTALSGSNRSK